MKVLYICTHNRCRSILSEAITNHQAPGLVDAKSAGSHPCGEVHPLSLKYLEEASIPTAGLQSQSWDEFKEWSPDVVITVCDAAAGETCPIWFGQTLRIHWALADPSKVEGTEEEKAVAFRKTIAIIKERVDAMKEIAGLTSAEERATKFEAAGAVVVSKPKQ